MKVVKFGGSSVKDHKAMIRCAKIVEKDPLIRVVIISATYNTTNLLEKIAKLAISNNERELSVTLDELLLKHISISESLKLKKDVSIEIKKIVKELESQLGVIKKKNHFSLKQRDEIYAIGERLSSYIFGQYLISYLDSAREIEFLDIREVLKTDSNFGHATPLLNEIQKNSDNVIMPLLNNMKKLVVTQGFIGSDLNGDTTSLGREGSDYSAALLAEALNAKEVQIWTDVQGIASADPKIIKEAKTIDYLSYDEAEDMAYLGAKILFPRTLLPLRRMNIPLYIGSTIYPELDGTWVKENEFDKDSLKSLAIKENLMLVTIKNNYGKELDSFTIKKELLEFDFDFCQMHFDDYSFTFLVENMEADFKAIFKDRYDISVKKGLSLVSLVGGSNSVKWLSKDSIETFLNSSIGENESLYLKNNRLNILFDRCLNSEEIYSIYNYFLAKK